MERFLTPDDGALVQLEVPNLVLGSSDLPSPKGTGEDAAVKVLETHFRRRRQSTPVAGTVIASLLELPPS
jgi:hypothetical protein